MKTVGLENDACQPQGPKSLRLTMRLETLERSGLFLVDLDFYNRVKARVLRGRGARCREAMRLTALQGDQDLRMACPNLNLSRDAKCLRTMVIILLEGWGYNNYRLLNFLGEKLHLLPEWHQILLSASSEEKTKPHLRHGRRCSQSAPISRVLIGQTRMQSRPGPCKRVLGYHPMFGTDLKK
ncbi:hypothetical protein FALCPG4_014472 [Fusarium falciforme]